MDAQHPTWAELRVHGVSGTPPESLLGVDHAVQVAGGQRSRFFRPADSFQQPVTAPDGHVLEAYHWGRWTSGSWLQGLWLLLIPFGIVNAAQFMLPTPDDSRRTRWPHAACGALLRVVALALTVLFSLGLTVVLADLIGWQWLTFRRPAGETWAVVLGLALVAVGVLGLSLLGRVRTGPSGPPVQGDYRSTLPDLGDPSFFDGDPDSPTLRLLHLAAGLQAPAVAGWWVALGPPEHGWVRVLLVAPVVAVVLVTALLGDPEQTVSQNPVQYDTVDRGKWRRWLGWSLLGVSTASLLGALIRLLDGGAAEASLGQALPAVDALTYALAATTVISCLLLLAVTAVLAYLTRQATPGLPAPFRRFAAGVLASLAATVGVLLATGLTAALALAAQRAVNTAIDVRHPSAEFDVQVPQFLQRVSYAWGVALVAGLLGLGVVATRGRLRRQEFEGRARAAAGWPTETGDWLLRVFWPRTVGAAMQRARWKNLVEPVVWGSTVLGLVLSVAAVVATTPGGPTLAPLTGVSSAPGLPVSSADVSIFLGSALLSGLAAAVLFVVRGAVRTTALRRGVNTVWDVVSFWPRAVHPFVPPPYSQQVVRPLIERISWLLGQEAQVTEPPRVERPVDHVVLAAHSQGSLVTALALLLLPRPLRARVTWLTCGSQLRVLFPRAFPHYVTYPLLAGLAARHQWVSLYRDTDPIGGPVASWDHSCDGSIPQSRRLVPGPYDRDAPDDPVGWWSTTYVEAYPDPDDPATALMADGPDPTDPLAAPAPPDGPRDDRRRVCGREWRLLDPPAADPAAQQHDRSRLHAHSDYWLDPSWPLALSTLRSAPPLG